MTKVLECVCVLQLLANEHTSPFLRVVRILAGAAQCSLQGGDGLNVVTALTRQYTTYLRAS